MQIHSAAFLETPAGHLQPAELVSTALLGVSWLHILQEHTLWSETSCPEFEANTKCFYRSDGHSPVSSKYGLATDQTLEWELIIGTGECVTANPTEIQDSYWALSGWFFRILGAMLTQVFVGQC